MHTDFDTDVIIVGGGFAGVSTARELNLLGFRTLLLEARDRLGGRTWTKPVWGTNLEMGGTWFHWIQPHAWSEISRYGIELKESPAPKVAYWMRDGKPQKGTSDDLDRMFEAGSALVADSEECFPRPLDPMFSKQLAEFDSMSVADRFEKLGLDPDAYEVNKALWNMFFMGSLEEGGLATALRMNALSSNNYQMTYWDTTTRFKLKTGTKSLLEGILSDAIRNELRLSSPVVKVEHEQGSVRVTVQDGTQFTARAVVMALPVNVFKNITFEPALSELKDEMFQEGHTAKGYKFWALFKGEIEPFQALASEDYPVSYAKCEEVVDGNTVVVGFGVNGEKLDPTDKEQMKQALLQWFPDQEILDTVAVNWEKEDYTLGTYMMLKKGQLTRLMDELQRPEHGLHIAGSDVAVGWNGFIDGAIQSGIMVGRQVAKSLGINRTER